MAETEGGILEMAAAFPPTKWVMWGTLQTPSRVG